MSQSITFPQNVRNFIERERRAGRHWIRNHLVQDPWHMYGLFYTGTQITTGHATYPRLFVIFDYRITLAEIAYYPNPHTRMPLYHYITDNNWNWDNLAEIPESFYDVVAAMRHNW